MLNTTLKISMALMAGLAGSFGPASAGEYAGLACFLAAAAGVRIWAAIKGA